MIFPHDPDPPAAGSAEPEARGHEASDAHMVVIAYRQAPDVTAEPVAVLTSWHVLASRGNHHVVGLTAGGSLRTSTPVAAWDPATRTAVTASGRRYVLWPAHVGSTAPGRADEVLLVLGDDAAGVVADVTRMYLPSGGAAPREPPERSAL